MANVSFNDANPTISKIKSGNNYYDIKDAAARVAIQSVNDTLGGVQSSINNLFQVVSSLPDPNAARVGTIYLTKNSNGQGTNVYDEYIVISGASGYSWEQFGTTQIVGEIPAQMSGNYTPEGTIDAPRISMTGGGLKYIAASETYLATGTKSINELTTNVSGETLEFNVTQQTVPQASANKVKVLTDGIEASPNSSTSSFGVLTEMLSAAINETINFRGTPAVITVR